MVYSGVESDFFMGGVFFLMRVINFLAVFFIL